MSDASGSGGAGSVDEGERLGFVLSGGGARGMFQAGVLEVLLQQESFRDPVVLSGTSAGAINAALLAKTGKVESMLEFWHAAAKDQPIGATARFYEDLYGSLEEIVRAEGPALIGERGAWRTLRGLVRDRKSAAGALLAAGALRLLKSRFPQVIGALERVRDTSLFEGDKLRARLVSFLGERVRPREGVALAVSVVDAHEGVVVRFATVQTDRVRQKEYTYAEEIPVDVILASASIPVLLPAVTLHTDCDALGSRERYCWDGGLLVNTPLAPVVDLGATRVLTVLCTIGERPSQPSFDNLNHALERLADTFYENTYNVDRKLLLTRNLLARRDIEAQSAGSGNALVKLHKPIRPAYGEVRSYVDFTAASIESMYATGRAAAQRWIDAGCEIEDELELFPSPSVEAPPPG